MNNIALQLYSLREFTQKDLTGTLKEVADAGYEGVEFAGYFNTSAKELKKALDTYGIKAAGSHVDINILMSSLEEAMEYSLEIGNEYVICPGIHEYMRDSMDAYKRTAELFNLFGQKCRKSGLKFGYHNHDAEFMRFDGEFGIDILINNTDPELLCVELDTYWVKYAGYDPLDFIQKYKERCAILHIKDMKSTADKKNTEVGKGILDFPAIVSAGINYGVSWYTVEQEEFEIPPFQSIKESLEYLRTIR